MTLHGRPPAGPALKLTVLALVVAALGLPINSLHAFGLLALSAFVLAAGTVVGGARRWGGALALTLLALGVHVMLSAPRIEEGHNVVLIDGPNGALEQGLPPAVYRTMVERFDTAYPENKRCASGAPYCWRPGAVPRRTFAFAADGIFDGHRYSRRVTDIDFDNAVWLRLGVINDRSLDILPEASDVARLQRDRRSLAIFGRWQVRLPFFVMYRFPAEFTGSDLCWRGEVLWEGREGQFERLEHAAWACRTLQPEDAGRAIFGLSIGPQASLAMSLSPNWRVTLHRTVEMAVTTIAVVGVLALLVRWRPRRMIFPLVLAAATLVLVVLIDATLVGGYRPFDGGDDGLIFAGFAREMLQHLAAGDLAGALQGVERVFYFNPGMRYFRALEFLAFGDTYLGYLLTLLMAPPIFYAVAARFMGPAWAFVFTLGFVLTPVGVLFGTSYINYVGWAARGYADPLGAIAFLAGLTLLAGPPQSSFDDRRSPAFCGALLMALAVMIRPNLAPGVGVLLGGVGLAALAARQFGRLAALCLGFSTILLAAWHNWHFGGVFVPISGNMRAPNVLLMTPGDYLAALNELVHLQFGGPQIAGAANQIIALLSGPTGLPIAIPLHVAAYVILVRVILSRRFEPMLRLVALAAVALTPVGLIYLVAVRYNLVMWFLMVLVVAAWIRIEGLALADAYRPGWRQRLGQSPVIRRLAAAVSWSQGFPHVDKAAATRL
jgi:hypothetical protein